MDERCHYSDGVFIPCCIGSAFRDKSYCTCDMGIEPRFRTIKTLEKEIRLHEAKILQLKNELELVMQGR